MLAVGYMRLVMGGAGKWKRTVLSPTTTGGRSGSQRGIKPVQIKGLGENLGQSPSSEGGK